MVIFLPGFFVGTYSVEKFIQIYNLQKKSNLSIQESKETNAKKSIQLREQ